MKIIHQHSRKIVLKGFTLVELIISISLFITIITIATGSIFSAQAVNAKLQSTHIILDGMNLSFELMTREVRYATIFYCGSDITLASARLLRQSCEYSPSDVNAGGTVLVFKPVDAVSPEDRKGYYLDNGRIFEWNYVDGFEQTPKQITSDEVTIDTLRFFVTGANTTDDAVTNGNRENKGGITDSDQPFITIVTSGTTYPRNRRLEPVQFQLETSITPRGIDN